MALVKLFIVKIYEGEGNIQTVEERHEEVGKIGTWELRLIGQN